MEGVSQHVVAGGVQIQVEHAAPLVELRKSGGCGVAAPRLAGGAPERPGELRTRKSGGLFARARADAQVHSVAVGSGDVLGRRAGLLLLEWVE